MNKPFFTIGTKLLITFLTVVFLASGGVAVVSVFSSRAVIQQEARDRLDTIADLKISQLRLWIERSKNILQGLVGGNIDFYNNLLDFSKNGHSISDEYLHERVDQFLLANPAFMEFLILDPTTGVQLFSSDLSRDNQSHTVFTSADPQFLKKAQVGPMSTGVVSSASDTMSAIMISTPFRDSEGNVRLIIAAHLNPLAMSDYLSDRFGLGETGLTYVVNALGHVVAGSENQFLSGQSVASYGISQGIAGKFGTSFYKNFQNKDVIGYYHWMPDLNAVFMAEQDASEALGAVTALEKELGIFISGILLISIIFSFIFSRYIAQPIRELTTVAQAISHGKLNLRADVKSSDEVGMLANAFNEMAGNLTSSFAESKHIIETMPEALFTLNADGTIRFVNHQAMKLSSCKSAALIGKSFMSLLVSDAMTAELMENLKHHQHVSDLQAFFIDCKHHKIPVSLSMTIVESKKIKGNDILVIVRDLRELQHYAKVRLQSVMPFLQQISLGDFSAALPAAQVSDEFSELFSGIGLMADNLKELMQENEEKTGALSKSNLQLKEAHDKLEEEKTRAEALLSSIGDAVVAIDQHENLLWFNQQAEHILHLSKAFIGKKYYEAVKILDVHGNIFATKDRPVWQVLTHKRIVNREVAFKSDAGIITPLVVVAAPVIVNHKFVGAIAIYRDVTKEKQIDKAKSEFVSLASHQLRTPLTSLKWILEELLRKGGLNKLQQEYITDGMKSNERMISLVNDLLNVSRLDAGRITVEPKATNVAELIMQVVHESKALAHTNRQKILFIKPKQPVVAAIDAQLVSQIVSNLLSNAIRYSDPGRTTTIRLLTDHQHLVITVEDHGMGIPKEFHHRMFEKFFRAPEASQRSTTGSGLGMYIIKRILDAMHGSIVFESEAGKGTAFTVRIPLKSESSPKSSHAFLRHRIS